MNADDLGLVPTDTLVRALQARYDFTAFVGVQRTGDSAHYKFEWSRPAGSGHPIDDMVVIGAIQMLHDAVVRKLTDAAAPPSDEHE